MIPSPLTRLLTALCLLMSVANKAIQKMYINGHFCYAYKFGVVTNGLGIIGDITFYDKDFLKAYPDIVVEKIRFS